MRHSSTRWGTAVSGVCCPDVSRGRHCCVILYGAPIAACDRPCCVTRVLLPFASLVHEFCVPRDSGEGPHRPQDHNSIHHHARDGCRQCSTVGYDANRDERLNYCSKTGTVCMMPRFFCSGDMTRKKSAPIRSSEISDVHDTIPKLLTTKIQKRTGKLRFASMTSNPEKKTPPPPHNSVSVSTYALYISKTRSHLPLLHERRWQARHRAYPLRQVFQNRQGGVGYPRRAAAPQAVALVLGVRATPRRRIR